jgi:CDP-diacylglycerol--glycerol-3-phosphate 3-phosphatidyltransferase
MKLNLPNAITLSRIPLMFVIVWLMYQGWTGAASLAFSLFLAGALGDWLDGYYARKLGLVSTFGKFMDALSDKIFVLGIMVAMVDIDTHFHMPVAFVLITLCREFLVSGMRMAAASKGVVVPADRGGKTKTLTQLIALGFLLAAPMVLDDWARLLPGQRQELTNFGEMVHYVGLGGFILGTFLAVWSGWRYIERHKALVFDDEPPSPPKAP